MKSLIEIISEYVKPVNATDFRTVAHIAHELHANKIAKKSTIKVDTALEPVEAYNKATQQLVDGLDDNFYKFETCQISTPRGSRISSKTKPRRDKVVKNKNDKILEFDILFLLNGRGEPMGSVLPRVNAAGDKIYGIAITDIVLKPNNLVSGNFIIENFGDNHVSRFYSFFGTDAPNTSEVNVKGLKDFLNRQNEFEEIRKKALLVDNVRTQSALAILNRLICDLDLGEFIAQTGSYGGNVYFTNFSQRNVFDITVARGFGDWNDEHEVPLTIKVEGRFTMDLKINNWKQHRAELRTTFENIAKLKKLMNETINLWSVLPE